MLSQDSAWLLNAQDLLSQGSVQEAKALLSEAIAFDQSEEDLFGTCCMRASLAAMEGGSSAAIANILQNVKGHSSSADKHSLRLYLEGASSLARGTGSMATAQLKFEECLRNDSGFVLANLGLAAAYFSTKQYQLSFAEYRKVLEALGDHAPSLCRVGLGLCSYFLKDLAHAQKCLQRALDVDPHDVFALLAALLLNVHTRNLKRLTESVNSLRKLVPDHVVVVQKIADLAFFKSNAQGKCLEAKASLQNLIRSVLPQATVAQTAYAKFQEGRLLHSTGDLDNAYVYLSEAVKSAPDLVAARIHRAKVLYQRKEVDEAVKELEYIDTHFQASKEVVTMLAVHSTMTGHHEAGMEYARRLGDLAPGDADTWALSAWCNRLDEEHAKLFLSRYCNIMGQQQQAGSGESLPIGARANMACFEERSLESLEGILTDAVGTTLFTRDTIPAELMPTIFNVALLLERSDVGRAVQHYKLLVKHFPMLTEPYVRLHELATQAGNRKQALAWLALLHTAHPDDTISTLYEARAFSAQQENSAAVAILQLAPKAKSPPVALAFASMCLKGAQVFSNKATQQLKYARDRYLFALKKDPSNLLAAHGIACCCAVLGDTETAQACLQYVAGLVTNDPYVVSNLRNHLINIKIGSDAFKQAAYLLSMETNKSAVQYAELAFCKCIDGDFDSGIALLEESIAKYGETPEASYNMAMVCAAAVMKGQSNVQSLSKEQGRRLHSILIKALQCANNFIHLEHVAGFESMQEAQRYLRTIARFTYELRPRIDLLLERGERARQYNAKKAKEWEQNFTEHQEALQRAAERERQQAAEAEAAQRQLREQLWRRIGVTAEPDGFAEEFPLEGGDDMADEGAMNENGKRSRDDESDRDEMDAEVMASLALESMHLGDGSTVHPSAAPVSPTTSDNN